MKIAYICLCHTDPAFIARMARALQYGEDRVFIHVDARSDIQPFEAAAGSGSNVIFVRKRYNSYWGGFNAVRAMVESIKAALSDGDYDRFILLQGQDYPLVSPKDIHSFFEENREKEYCSARDVSVSRDRRDYMKCCGFWYCDYDKKRLPLRALAHLLHSFNSLGIKYRSGVFHTSGGETWHIYHGWAQWALTGECVGYIVDCFDSMPDFNAFIRHRFPPDELYFQTLIHNSRYKDRLSEPHISGGDGKTARLNLTYFEYPVEVTVFTDPNDYHRLKQTGCLFVRKVNSASGELLDRIDREIK